MYNAFSKQTGVDEKINDDQSSKKNFEIQYPKTHGVKDYHFNHFIIYFDAEVSGDAVVKSAMSKHLTSWLYRAFSKTFNHKNIAQVNPGAGPLQEFEGMPTMGFNVGGNLGTISHRIMGALHPDWVVMGTYLSDSSLDKSSYMDSFSGTTLLRNFNTETENAIAEIARGTKRLTNSIKEKDYDLIDDKFILSLIDILSSKSKVNFFIEKNRKHFLAGRRSWRIGYDSKFDKFYVETLAVERFSDAIYDIANKLSNYFPNIVHDLRSDIKILWTHHMDNVVDILKYTTHVKNFKFIKTIDGDDILKDSGYKEYETSDKKINEHCFYTEIVMGEEKIESLKKGMPAWQFYTIKNHQGILNQIYSGK